MTIGVGGVINCRARKRIGEMRPLADRRQPGGGGDGFGGSREPWRPQHRLLLIRATVSVHRGVTAVCAELADLGGARSPADARSRTSPRGENQREEIRRTTARRMSARPGGLLLCNRGPSVMIWTSIALVQHFPEKARLRVHSGALIRR